MRRSWDRFITTHVGSLSRSAELLTLNKARAGGGADVTAYATGLAAAVTDVVNKQRDVGVDIPNDGEFGKPMSAAYDMGLGGTTPSSGWMASPRPIRSLNPNIKNRPSPSCH